MKLGFIGAGTVANALALALSEKGYNVAAVTSRSRSSADNLARKIAGCCALDNSQAVAEMANVIFITTPDDAIASVAASVKWPAGISVIHASGADSASVLEKTKLAGAKVGVFHPLQTFSGVNAIDNLPGITYALEAEEPLLGTLKEMAEKLGGHWIQLKPQDRALYHAAAVIASNYTVTLMKMAASLWQTFGVSQPEAVRALLPLLKGTVNNIDNVGIPQCLTGPISRGDFGTISKHLAALNSKAPEMVSAYCELGLMTIPIATAKGKINEKQTTVIQNILRNNQETK